MKHFYCNHLAQVIVCWQVKIFMCFYTVPVFVFFKTISKYKPSGAYIQRGDLTEESVCITSLDGLYLEGLIHGGIFPECSVQYIGQVSNRVKTLSRLRILWNVLILSYLWLCFLL